MTKEESKNLEKKYQYKKHLIHLLVLGALALSWGTIGHVSGFMHSHLGATQSKSKTSQRKKQKQGGGTKVSDTTAVASDTPPPPAEPATPAAPVAAPIVSHEAATPAAPKAAAPSDTSSSAAKVTREAAPTHADLSASSILKAALGTQSSGIKAQSGGEDITKTKVDLNFIRLVEGSVMKGYVPLATTTNSGVTIADGFDLGQMHLSEFNKLPITDALKGKLQPYIGLTRLNAKNFLKSHPLTINSDELTQLNAVAANKILIPLAQAYNKNSKVQFNDLPAQAQTAIFSYAYQHGPGFMRSASGKALWNCFTTQNWSKASALLKSAKMYSGRRHQEAALLDRLA